MEEKAPTKSAMVSRLPKFGGRSSTGGAIPLTNGSTPPTTPTQDGKTTPPGTRPNGVIRTSPFSLKWKRDEGTTPSSPTTPASPGDGVEDKAQTQLPSLAKEVKNGSPATPKMRRSGALMVAVSSPKAIPRQSLKMSPKVGTKLGQSPLNGGPIMGQNGSSIPARAGSESRLVRPRFESSSPRSSSQDSLSQSSDSLKTLAQDNMVRSNSFTHFKQIPSPTSLPMIRSFSFNRAVELAKPLANTQLRPPRSSYLKPPQLSNGRVGLGLGGLNGSLGCSGGLGGGLQYSRPPSAASSLPTLSIPPAPNTPNALRKPLLPSCVLNKSLGSTGGALGFRLARSGQAKQQNIFPGRVKGDIRPLAAPECAGLIGIAIDIERTGEGDKADSQSDSDGSSGAGKGGGSELLRKISGQTAAETLEDMSLSSASSLDRGDTSEEFLDDFDNVGDVFNDGDLPDNRQAASTTQTRLHSFLIETLDWDSMDLAGHTEESPMQDSQGPLGLSSEQSDVLQASSVELSPSNSSGGTYMWDEDGLEPLGGPRTRPCDSYEDSELNSMLAEGSKYTAIVQHINEDFAILSLGDTAQLTVIQTSNHLNEPFRSELEKLKAGMILAVEVIEPSCQQLQDLALVSWKRCAPQQHTPLENETSVKGHLFGEIVKGIVRTVKPASIQVTLKDGSTGSVHVSEVLEPANVCIGSFPTSTVIVGSSVTARVIGGRDASSHRFLPFSHPRFTYTIPELTLIPSKVDQSYDLKAVAGKDRLNNYTVGEEITCFVSKFNPKKKILEVTTGPCVNGTVDLLAMITDPKDAGHPEKLYKLGQAVNAKVLEIKSKPHRFMLSLTGVHTLEKGSVALGMVTNIHPQIGLLVNLPFGNVGTVAVTDLTDAYKPNPLAAYSKDQLLRCFLLGCENRKWQLSLRPSRLNPEQTKPPKDPEALSIDNLQEGQLIRGYIQSVAEHGVFIKLSRSITGRAQLQHSTKYFVNSHTVLAEHLTLNTLLTTKIHSIDREKELVHLSLLPGDTGKADVLPESLGLPPRLTGEAKKKYDLKKKKRTASESEQTPAESQVSNKKKKAKTDDNDSGVEVNFREDKKKKYDLKKKKCTVSESEQKQAEAQVPNKKKKKAKADDSKVGVYFREEEDKKDEKPKSDSVKVTRSSTGPSRLQVAAGFSWDVHLSSLKPASAAQEGDSSDGEDQDGSSKPQRKSRHELQQEKKAAEKALVQRETELMDPSLRPQDAAAFERLLLASPNSSLLWLQYMANHLQATQIEQARAVAERALKTISFREEQEKLNVWVALLNLENMYGTEESLKKVFERALQFCEPMPVYQQLADIYAKSDKTKEADGLYKTMVKRFRQNKAVWLSYGTFLLQQGQSDSASVLLQRALTSLPSKESVDVIAKFAQLEFRYGDSEKGRTMFDKVLTSYPKRTDLWSVFIDLMVKRGSQKEVRELFDRVIHLSVSVKKIKFFFKRYLEYEKKHGTPQSIQAVKEKAMEFVEAKGTEAAN